MLSEYFTALNNRVHSLKINFLPPVNVMGKYTSHEEDKMRSFRMLVHAEMEHYLELVCEVFIADLERDIQHSRGLGMARKMWAEKALVEAKSAKASNNGIKKSDILQMFKPFGFDDSFFDAVDPVFLDRMAEFGKNRGDVAHKSALRATYKINCAREGSMIIELMGYLVRFDELMFARRIRSLLED